jgi:hypothetical protein
MNEENKPNRQQRRAARTQGQLDTAGFLKVADTFIDLANRHNKQVQATQLHMAFLFAAARYNAHVGKSVLEVKDHEEYVETMTGEYRDFLRQHLADGALSGSGSDGEL